MVLVRAGILKKAFGWGGREREGYCGNIFVKTWIPVKRSANIFADKIRIRVSKKKIITISTRLKFENL